MVMVTSLGVMATSGRAQVAEEHDDLHDRLDAARANIAHIQAEADSVEEQIASIDEQAEAVAKALAASRELAARAQARIGFLERVLVRKEQFYRRMQQRVEDVAVSLYKGGPTAELGILLSADSFDELSSLFEYSSAATQDRIQIMVKTRRLQVELDADRAELEVTLAEALEAREEQERQAQHLKELRQAQTAKLADLRDEIESSREEAAAIQTRSEEIERQLDARASAASVPPVSESAPPVSESAPPASESAPPASESAPPAPGGVSDFAWPINGAITSGFGSRWGGTHSGIDIDCVTGDAIRASKSGSVVAATYDGGYGYHVVIDHGAGFASLYAHNSTLGVSSGQTVSQGEVIATCGSTGQSTGDHLHFEIRVSGTPQDPLGYLP